jgi:hypothetical protein
MRESGGSFSRGGNTCGSGRMSSACQMRIQAFCVAEEAKAKAGKWKEYSVFDPNTALILILLKSKHCTISRTYLISSIIRDLCILLPHKIQRKRERE